MSLRKSVSLIKIMFRFRFTRYKLFKTDSLLNFISNLVFLLGSILFWYLITDAGFLVEGWSYSEILVFVALSEMFYGFEQNIFSKTSLFWSVIYNGALDAQLVRPFDPRKRFLLLNMDYAGLLISFIKVAAILLLAGLPLNPFLLLVGIAVIFVSNYVLMLIRLMLCYLSFWFGKMDSVTQICDSMTKLNKYPLVILPKTLRLLFSTVLPFYFFSTFSAELVLDKLTEKNLLLLLAGLLLNVVLWSLLNKILWEKGRARYESLNG